MATRIPIRATLAGAKAAVELFDQLDKDKRASTAIRSLGHKIATAAKSTSPQQRLEKQLTLVEEYALKVAERPECADEAAQWLLRASSIREKLPLVAAMKARVAKRTFKTLEDCTAELLKEIIERDLEPES